MGRAGCYNCSDSQRFNLVQFCRVGLGGFSCNNSGSWFVIRPDGMIRELEFKILCERHSDQIYRYARALLANQADAEDATQEVLLRLWRHLPRLNPFNLKAWLLQTTRCYCLDQIRRRSNRAAPLPLEEGVLEQQPDEFAVNPAWQPIPTCASNKRATPCSSCRRTLEACSSCMKSMVCATARSPKRWASHQQRQSLSLARAAKTVAPGNRGNAMQEDLPPGLARELRKETCRNGSSTRHCAGLPPKRPCPGAFVMSSR